MIDLYSTFIHINVQIKCALQTSTDLELTVEKLRLSATTVLKCFLHTNNALSKNDRPHNDGITTQLFVIDVYRFYQVPGLRVWSLGLQFNVLILEDVKSNHLQMLEQRVLVRLRIEPKPSSQ